jgi:hypothetical protein
MQIDNTSTLQRPRKKKPCTVERCQECERPGDRYNMGGFYVFFCEFHAGYYALRLQRYALGKRA